jgi:hypothetical protein
LFLLKLAPTLLLVLLMFPAMWLPLVLRLLMPAPMSMPMLAGAMRAEWETLLPIAPLGQV